MSTPLPPILGVSEVMEVLGVSQVTVLRLAGRGVIRGRKLGTGLRSPWAFRGEDVQEYLDTLGEVAS